MSDTDKRWRCWWLPDHWVGEFLANLCDRRERERERERERSERWREEGESNVSEKWRE